MSNLSVNNEITLHPVSMDMAQEIFKAVDSDRDHLRKWLPWVDITRTVNDTKAFCEMCSEQLKAGKGYQFCISYKGKVVGGLGQHDIDEKNKKTSLGYWLHSDYTGKGIMTQSCEAFIRYIFEVQKLNRIELRAATENIPSKKIAQRLGFKPEGISRQAEWIGDRVLDHQIYALLKSEWDELNN
ncbi:MAG: RimJ/RimL family protein N-acetyltransferase [Halobacteriovoraceae bacterium]|nr:RimJ/RimL family protein N-acetyltransferase [Halobacteriovoraceae bacterium]|tara:strand:- start:2120 stop:2671 length:552 start_codon:yes stop_codon:yes gene_type:complete